MRQIAFLLVGVVALAGIGASMASLSGQADGEPAQKEGQPQAGAVAGSRDDLASKLARREARRSPSSIPGREIVQVETLIPPGFESGWHVHPSEEVGYIIVGQFPGDGFLIPLRTPHNARDLGPETGRMLSTYIVETGQPIATFVGEPVQR